MKVKIAFVYWDCKEDPDWGEIQKAINAVFDGAHAPCIVAADDGWGFDWDQHTIAISSSPVPKNKRQSLGKKWLDLRDEEPPFIEVEV